MMRRTELNTGIAVCDKEGTPYGNSKAAAATAVSQTSVSRFVLAVPIMLPPVLLFGIEKMNMIPKNKAVKIILDLSLMAT